MRAKRYESRKRAKGKGEDTFGSIPAQTRAQRGQPTERSAGGVEAAFERSKESTSRGASPSSSNNPDEVKPSDGKADPGWKFENHLFLASLVVLAVSVIVLLCAVQITYQRTHVPYKGVATGQPITSGSSTITVTNIRHAAGTTHFAAPQGKEYLMLTLMVRNNGEKPIYVAPSLDTYVKTADGQVVYLTPYELTEPFHAGLILPGESTTGELSYLVPKNAEYKFYVEAGWSTTAVPFVVQSTNNHKRSSV